MEQRILIVDDNQAIHEDFKKILAAASNSESAGLQDARAAFFGDEEEEQVGPSYRLDSAFQGQEALEMVKQAKEEGDPYLMAFVDVRMPPGWDGVQTIVEMWKVAPELECVICTAFADYTWSEMAAALGQSDKLLILKKPFDPVEARQFASTLTTKAQVQAEQERMTKALVAAEAQAKAYAASLETVNQALRTSKASADKAAEMRGEFLQRLSGQVSQDLTELLQVADESADLEPAMERCLEQSRALLNTVTGVVDYTQIESGSYALHQEQVDLCSVLTAALGGFQERAQEQGVELHVELGAGTESQYLVDATSVSKLVQLLVDNAMRHGGGQVTTKAWVERSGDWTKSTLLVQVTDAGPGLPDKFQGQLYEPLSGAREGSRFGIGLALAKQLVQCLGGDLSYEPVEPCGTRFTFSVRLAEPNANQAA